MQHPLKIGISGATGFIGGHLVGHLKAAGHQPVLFVRDSTRVRNSFADSKVVIWDVTKGPPDFLSLEQLDGFVHLAGAPIAARWTRTRKKMIRDSRVLGTRYLVEAMRRCDNPPRVLICGSGIDYYGNQGDEILDESSPAGTGFLSEVCVEWEREAGKASELGVRVVCVRTGLVLSTEGGALVPMLIPFRLGLGGVLGTGEQYISWIHIRDHLRLLAFLLTSEGISGPVNATAPHPVTNRDFTKSLGNALGRPTFMKTPALLMRLLLGEMGDTLLLNGRRVVPAKALESGYRFEFETLKDALDNLFK
ncbi:MAG TPA: TIGR01777 family oxidoreductase [Acidobacteriota bacterium]|nr:TIGR01777 family oxidoreductase [Acidobacteriota bacterium]